MSDQTTFQRLQKIIAEQTGREESEITEHSLFEADLDCDSLDAVEILMAVEEEFDLTSNEELDEKFEKCISVGDVVKLIDEVRAQ